MVDFPTLLGPLIRFISLEKAILLAALSFEETIQSSKK